MTALSTVEMENVDVILFTNSITEASIVKIDRDDNLSTIEKKILPTSRVLVSSGAAILYLLLVMETTTRQ
jgi:hypothetical protein